MNAGLRAIGHFAGQLHAADYRPGTHQDRIRLGQLHALRRDLVVGNVLLNTKLLSGEALLLHTQRHDNVGAVQGGIEIVRDGDSGRSVAAISGAKSGGPQKTCPLRNAKATPRWSALPGCDTHRQATTRNPLSRFLWSVMVKASSKASGRMLMHAIAGIHESGVAHNAPSEPRGATAACRTPMTSAPRLATVQPVSISDSPFSMLEETGVTSVVVAPRVLAAN